MYFKLKSNVMFRNYDSFGYITDNRNFAYKRLTNDEHSIGDKIVSESGAVFLSVLSKKPQAFSHLVDNIQKHFMDTDIKSINDDARDFYRMLEKEGFIISGESMLECYEKDSVFSYNTSIPKSTNIVSSQSDIQCGKSTQEFFEVHFKGKPRLTDLHIEITSKCNERCVHCYIPHENKTNDLEPDLFYDILMQCREMNVLHLTLSGGEPLLHKNICDFLEKCNEYGFSVNVLSNLTLLNDKMVSEMKRNRLLGVQVSLYSMDSNIHDEITQMKGSFEKTTRSIMKLVENDIPLQISCPILKQNRRTYREVIDWAAKYDISVGDDYAIIAKYNHSIQNLNSRLSIDEVNEIIHDKIINDRQYLVQIEDEADKKKNSTPDDFVCSVCNSSICIADNGNVYPCAGWQDYVVGNIQEESLKEIWEKSEKIEYLRKLKKRDFSECVQCLDKNYCTMCMVRNANEDPLGNPLVVSSYFCSVVKCIASAVHG